MYIKPQIDSISETTLIKDFYKSISDESMLISYRPGYYVEKTKKNTSLKLNVNNPIDVYKIIQNLYIERDSIIDIKI